ncbi:MAG: hypothetical protein K2G67_07765 [Muribaculaceae bacterium]|nr:hypothetical protein [Muribaculaceae bacterium]
MINKILRYLRKFGKPLLAGSDKPESRINNISVINSNSNYLSQFSVTKEQEILNKLKDDEIEISNIPYIQEILSTQIKERLAKIEDWRDSNINYGECQICKNITVKLHLYKETLPTRDTFIKISECDISLCSHCKSCLGLIFNEISSPQEVAKIREQIRKEEEMDRQFELNYHRIMSGKLPYELSDTDVQELASYSRAKHREEEYLFLRNNHSLKQGNIKAVCISNQDPTTGIKETLEIGETYMIDFVIVGSSYTHVYLSEFPDKSFNSLLFNYYQDDEKFFLNKDYKALRIIDPDIFTHTTLIIYRDLSKEAMDKIKQKYDRLIVVNRSDILSQLYTN